MNFSDYRMCDKCQGKTFYDVEVKYQDDKDLPVGVGAWVVLCEQCAESYEVIAMRKPGP